jgi:hypothetical protein
MRSGVLVVVTLIGTQLALPALAQTSDLNFSNRTPAAPNAATPKAKGGARSAQRRRDSYG